MLRDDIIEYILWMLITMKSKGKKLRKNDLENNRYFNSDYNFRSYRRCYNQTNDYWQVVKWLFIGLTLLKAGYIILSFMHLGDERKALKYCILAPYVAFIAYLIFIALSEAMHVDAALMTYGVRIKHGNKNFCRTNESGDSLRTYIWWLVVMIFIKVRGCEHKFKV